MKKAFHATHPDSETPPQKQRQVAFWLAVTGLLVAFCTYFHGLGSVHILRNGDELVYAHITRVTSLAERWLPLQGIPGMRNTKPPLLFWQGLLSTDWGKQLVSGGPALAVRFVELCHGAALRPAGLASVQTGPVYGDTGSAVLSGFLHHLPLRTSFSDQST